jgi:vacuolar-type H+-ATPase subunit I/STV1
MILKDYLISLYNDESGLGTVEIVMIIAILVGLALIFRSQIFSFVNQLFEKIFSSAGDSTLVPNGNENPQNVLGG